MHAAATCPSLQADNANFFHAVDSSSALLLACNWGVFLGRANAIAAILDSKRRGRLGRVERSTKILQIQHGRYDQPRFWHSRFPGKRLHCRLRCYRTQLYGRLLNYEYNYFTKHFKAPRLFGLFLCHKVTFKFLNFLLSHSSHLLMWNRTTSRLPQYRFW